MEGTLFTDEITRGGTDALSDPTAVYQSDPTDTQSDPKANISTDSISDAVPDNTPDHLSGSLETLPKEEEVQEASTRFGKDALANFDSTMRANIQNLREKVSELTDHELSYMMEENMMCTKLYKEVYTVLLTERLARMGRDSLEAKKDATLNSSLCANC